MRDRSTILCAVDFSPHSAAALRYAHQLSRALEMTLHVVHAETLELPAYFTSGRIAELETQIQAGRAEAEASLRHFVAEALGEAADHAGYSVVDRPAVEGILDTAEKAGAAMIVMGTRGRTGLERVLIGSVAERVVHSSRIPVMVVRGSASGFHQILCAVDDSEASAAALRQALQLASAFQAELTAVHVREPGSAALSHGFCEKFAPGYATMKCIVREVIKEGDPAADVLRLAREMPADLLVAGSRQKTFFDHLTFGTTTMKLLRHAPCPTMLVPQED